MNAKVIARQSEADEIDGLTSTSVTITADFPVVRELSVKLRLVNYVGMTMAAGKPHSTQGKNCAVEKVEAVEASKVLLVDDDVDLLESLQDLLEAEEYCVQVAKNPALAQKIAENWHPDVALIDVNLGAASGLDLMPLFKERFPDISCIIMTASTLPENAVRAVRYGADDYLIKPIEPTKLMKALRRSLRQQRLERENTAAIAALRESEARTKAIMWNVADGLITINEKGTIESTNPMADSFFGYDEGELLGQDISILMPKVEGAAHGGHVRKYIETGKAKVLGIGPRDVIGRRKDDSLFEIELAVSDTRIGDKHMFIGAIRDITERKKMEANLHHISTHDSLTGLPNRMLALDRLEQALEQVKRNPGVIGIMFIDIDNFKVINDSIGHDVGDLLLQGVAERLKFCLRKADTVARFGGDEFVVISYIESARNASLVAQKILEVLSAPFNLRGHEVTVGASIGISLSPNDGADPQTLFKNTDMAMYDAKKSGKNTYKFFTNEMNEAAVERLNLVHDLRRAIQGNELVLVYQPQVDALAGKIIGLEALLRWHHPERGLIPPAEFIGVVEETELISLITAWVLSDACAQAKAWQEDGLPPLRISINISGEVFRRTSLLDMVEAALQETGLAPDCLALEITESVFLGDLDKCVDLLTKLRAKGIHICIDDFGTGFSSLNYLKQFPVDVIKIDRSFICEITRGEDDAAIVTAIISIAESLNLGLIAEGVEEEEQLKFLRSKGCNNIQGYYFSCPLPVDAVPEFIRNFGSTDPRLRAIPA